MTLSTQEELLTVLWSAVSRSLLTLHMLTHHLVQALLDQFIRGLERKAVALLEYVRGLNAAPDAPMTMEQRKRMRKVGACMGVGAVVFLRESVFVESSLMS